jgi:hypothetical protein
VEGRDREGVFEHGEKIKLSTKGVKFCFQYGIGASGSG